MLAAPLCYAPPVHRQGVGGRHGITVMGRKPMKQFRATVLAAVAFASFFSASVAEAARWTGGGTTTDWNDSGNWANGQLPSATSVVELTGNASVSLSGDCAASCIMNMADSPVTLTLTADADVRLAASICGDIAVEKHGSGRLSLAARQSYTGETRVIEGTLTTAPDLSYADYSTYGTLSVHLDSSHPETLVADGNGDLSEWKSLTDNGVTVYILRLHIRMRTHPSSPVIRMPADAAPLCSAIRAGARRAPAPLLPPERMEPQPISRHGPSSSSSASAIPVRKWVFLEWSRATRSAFCVPAATDGTWQT